MTNKNDVVKKQKQLASATGRRKSAIATANIFAGTGKLTYRSKSALSDNQKKTILSPLALLQKDSKYDVVISVTGGGIQSSVEAARLAVARASVELDAEAKLILRKNGLLTRDNRVKERKKPGLRRARRAPQWAKR